MAYYKHQWLCELSLPETHHDTCTCQSEAPDMTVVAGAFSLCCFFALLLQASCKTLLTENKEKENIQENENNRNEWHLLAWWWGPCTAENLLPATFPCLHSHTPIQGSEKEAWRQKQLTNREGTWKPWCQWHWWWWWWWWSWCWWWWWWRWQWWWWWWWRWWWWWCWWWWRWWWWRWWWWWWRWRWWWWRWRWRWWWWWWRWWWWWWYWGGGGGGKSDEEKERISHRRSLNSNAGPLPPPNLPKRLRNSQTHLLCGLTIAAVIMWETGSRITSHWTGLAARLLFFHFGFEILLRRLGRHAFGQPPLPSAPLLQTLVAGLEPMPGVYGAWKCDVFLFG